MSCLCREGRKSSLGKYKRKRKKVEKNLRLGLYLYNSLCYIFHAWPWSLHCPHVAGLNVECLFLPGRTCGRFHFWGTSSLAEDRSCGTEILSPSESIGIGYVRGLVA